MQQGLSAIQGATEADVTDAPTMSVAIPVAPDAAFTPVGRFSFFARPL